MDFSLSDEHKLFRSTIRDFVDNEIRPVAREWERSGRYPTEIVESMGQLGLFGLTIPSEYGGLDSDLVTLAMNGWSEGEPAWWLNLQANPIATIELADGRHAVKCRAATGEERTSLWARWRTIDDNLDAYAARRSGETAVVILEPIEEHAASDTG